MANRPLCIQCNARPAAYNYKKGNKVYYRKRCDVCVRKNAKKKTNGLANWQKAGYNKKQQCESCGFQAQHEVQLDVHHIDGNRNNNSYNNLKTLCANCLRLRSISKTKSSWRQGHLIPDNL